jgi:oligopeptide/dipeptide ABC transporter ATP-binding protein
MKDLLRVENLTVDFGVHEGTLRAVDHVSFSLPPGGTLALVGESGSGKSVCSQAIMGLLPRTATISSGSILFNDARVKAAGSVDIAALDRAGPQMRAIRGGAISIIFQEPMTSLNPVFTVGTQIGEAVRLHQHLDRGATRERVIAALRRVEIPEPERRAKSYPHELSGGMRQRAMIAMALACEPSLLIADEPTTALDVTIQAQILDLLRSLRDSLGMAMILITHDLGIVAEQADEVAVMYAGRIVEQASVVDVFERPLHPYTIALVNAAGQRHGARQHRLEALQGTVPSLFERPSGCRFRDRCPRAIAECADVDPMLEEKAPAHTVACIRA